MKLFIGIDPGKSGAIAFLPEDGEPWTIKLDNTDHDIVSAICDAFIDYDQMTAVLEKVHAMPGQGVTSMFNFGQSFGAMKMLLAASKIPFELVTPQKWQTALGCRSGGQKNVTKAKAQQLFPSIKITHAIADALLLAEYARRINSNQNQQNL